jgi:hypothetical protein
VNEVNGAQSIVVFAEPSVVEAMEAEGIEIVARTAVRTDHERLRELVGGSRPERSGTVPVGFRTRR